MKNHWLKRREDKEIPWFCPNGLKRGKVPSITDVWIKEMNDNAWHHLLEVANGDDHKLYVDGVLHEKLLD